MFQSTPARGGRRRHERLAGIFEMFQSTPARGGRRAAVLGGSQDEAVSIHARTRRATASCVVKSCFRAVSIHARTRRATTTLKLSGRRPWRFNPRPHAAGDCSCSKIFGEATLRLGFREPGDFPRANHRVRQRCRLKYRLHKTFCQSRTI